MRIPSRFFTLTLFALLSLCQALCAQNTNIIGAQSNVTDPNYVLIIGDTLSIQVLEETELAASQLIDKDGNIRVSLLGDLPVTGLTVRAAEQYIEKAYIDQEILKRPQVRINVTAYAPRTVTILGAIKNPGKVSFSRDSNNIDIVDAITHAGGFTAVARRDQVTVSRTDVKGQEQSFIVNVEAMISGKTKDKPRSFDLKPGDRLFIPERIF